MGGESRTITVLFSDVVGSTELRSRVGDVRADALLSAHDEATSAAVTAHGGREVKRLGDGVLAVFDGAAPAIECGVVIQQSTGRTTSHHGERLAVRVGIAVGDVASIGGDVSGTPVVEAARLCAAAGAGEILCSDLVRALAGTRTTQTFETVGDLELKGLPAPVVTWRVPWERRSDATWPVPALLDVPAPFPFVRRSREWEALERAWKDATAGTQQVVLIAGEPGIGKTRLCAELAHSVHADGALVLAGRCDEELGLPYQPIVEALRHFVDHADADRLPAMLGPLAGELRRLLPELHVRLPDLPAPLDSDADTERARLFDAVAGWLDAAATEMPVLLVLDDLHWATKPTLLAMRHLAMAAAARRVLIVGTYRGTDLDRTHPLSAMLGDLRRAPSTTRLAITGMDVDQVEAFVENAWEVDSAADGVALARLLHAQTDGNPFFLVEVLRHLMESGVTINRSFDSGGGSLDELEIPEGVREVVGRRLSRLSDECNAVLSSAAVLGRDFDVATLVAMVGDAETVIAAVEEAEPAGLVVEGGGREATYSFSHALVRQTLYEEISLARRQRLHVQAAEAIESAHGMSKASLVAAHYRQAGTAADPEKIVAASLAAASVAQQQLAWEEATSHWETALELLDARGGDPRQTARLLEQLGDAMYAIGTDWQRGIDQLDRARTIYESLGDRRQAAKVRSRIGRNLATFPGRMDITRAQHELAVAEEVLREQGGVALGLALIAKMAAHWQMLEAVDGRVAGERAVAIAREAGHPGLESLARSNLGTHLALLGRPREAWSELEAGTELAAATGEALVSYISAYVRGGFARLYLDPVPGIEATREELSSGRLAGAPGLRTALEQIHGELLADIGAVSEVGPVVDLHVEAVMDFYRGEWERADDVFSRSLERAEREGNRAVVGYGLHYRVMMAVRRGDLEAAERWSSEGVALGELGGAAAIEALHRPFLARVRYAVGDAEQARRHARRCLDLVDGPEDFLGLATLTWTTVGVTAEDDDDATVAFERAVDAARRHRLPFLEADALEQWGLRTGDEQLLDQAGAVYEQAGAGDSWLTTLERLRRR